MRRAGLLVAFALAGVSAIAVGQLVPLARCHAAYPCSVPYGLRPADAVANNPDAALGNSLVGVGVDNAFKPRLLSSPVSSDPSEAAARRYVKKYPLRPKTTGTPGPGPKATAAPNSTPGPKATPTPAPKP
jgi:hypothetical protein